MKRTLLALTTLLTACSGGDAGAVTAAPPGSADCIEEFVQVFEESNSQPAPASPENLCFDQAAATGPPVFPTSSRRVSVEFKNGDWFATQESAHWTFGDFDAQRRCTTAILSRSKITAMKRGDTKESTRLADGKLARSTEAQRDFATAIPLGSAPGVVPQPANEVDARVESTSFGVDCTRVTAKADANGMSVCAVNMPRSCAASRVMLPIEIRVPDATGGARAGKTVSLRTGAIVDPNSWVLP